MASPLVSTDWLKTELEKESKNTRKNLILLDTTWLPTMNGYEAYLKSHIPGAQYFDVKACGKATREIPRCIPEVSLFQEYLRSFGICKDSHVVVYDRDDGQQIISVAADRTWWIFRLLGHENISVLDGGLHKWEKDGYHISSGDDKPENAKGDVECHVNYKLIKSFPEMQTTVKESSSQVIDTRMDFHFSGNVPEPNDFISLVVEDAKLPPLRESEIVAGHMDNAKNISFLSLKKPNSPDHLSKEEYLKLFEENSVNLQQPIAATCYIGHTACVLALAAAVCGKNDAAVYAGSWTEWGQMMAKQKSNY